MDAINLLEEQHRELEDLLDQATRADQPRERQRLFEQISDALAVHATIEEKIFYPALYEEETADLMLEATEEHLAAKRVIADLLELSPEDPHYAAKLTLLKEEIRHHLAEERKEMFPLAKRLLGRDALQALGQQMEAAAVELEERERAPRFAIPSQTARAAELR